MVFRSTAGPKRSVTVEAKRAYGMSSSYFHHSSFLHCLHLSLNTHPLLPPSTPPAAQAAQMYPPPSSTFSLHRLHLTLHIYLLLPPSTPCPPPAAQVAQMWDRKAMASIASKGGPNSVCC